MRSKQFLKILQDPFGNPESMIQRVWRQLAVNGLNGNAVFATSQSQKEMLYKQLGADLKVITEPERRDTFPAIALAAAYLSTVEGVSRQEVVSVLPVDPMVDDSFFAKVAEMERALADSGANMALIGARPVFPTEKYGYIMPEENNFSKDYFAVKGFREKPDREEAQKLIEEKALWNCGVFSFKLGFLLGILEKLGIPTDYDKLLAFYSHLPKISFDYQVVEKTDRLVVLPYNGQWKDLGTWNTLSEELGREVWGKGIILNSHNVHLINELDIPVAMLGLNDSVVVATPDGILVSDKQSSPQIKEVVRQIKQRPMYEERAWGWYKVLEHVTYDDGYEVLVKRLGIEAGKNLSYQKHYSRSETWTVVQGQGEAALNGVIFPIQAGTVLEISRGDAHSIRANTSLEVIEIQKGKGLIEEDIERFFFDWKEIKANSRSKQGILKR